MTTRRDRACQLAEELNARHAAGRSWRVIAREDYGDQVSFATLNRIANSAGRWLPKQQKILVTLGLVQKKETTAHERRVRRRITKMAKATREAVMAK